MSDPLIDDVDLDDVLDLAVDGPEDMHLTRENSVDEQPAPGEMRDPVYDDTLDPIQAMTDPLWAPKAQPGKVQRWVRMTVQNKHDGKNVRTQRRLGWVPRSIDSLDEKDKANLGIDADQGDGLIWSGDLILCEMDEERAAKFEEHNTKQRLKIARAVNGRVDAFNDRVDPSLGFERLEGGEQNVKTYVRQPTSI